MCPIIKNDDLVGGLYVPSDGAASATDICMSLSRIAKDNGKDDQSGQRGSAVLAWPHTLADSTVHDASSCQ
jgi:pyruvate dehydrogenase phosphatase regulatory subunit